MPAQQTAGSDLQPGYQLCTGCSWSFAWRCVHVGLWLLYWSWILYIALDFLGHSTTIVALILCSTCECSLLLLLQIQKSISLFFLCYLCNVIALEKWHHWFLAKLIYTLSATGRENKGWVTLAAWHYIYVLSCLHQRLNEWINSHSCPVLIVNTPREKKNDQVVFIIVVTILRSHFSLIPLHDHLLSSHFSYCVCQIKWF